MPHEKTAIPPWSPSVVSNIFTCSSGSRLTTKSNGRPQALIPNDPGALKLPSNLTKTSAATFPAFVTQIGFALFATALVVEPGAQAILEKFVSRSAAISVNAQSKPDPAVSSSIT